MRTLRGRLVLGAVMVAAGVALGGGGGSESDSSGSSATATATGDATTAQATAAPEDTIAPDAEVSAGLVKLKGVAAQAAGAADGDQAKEASAGLEAVWRPIEGTVKKN